VYANSPVAADGNSEDSTGKEGILGCNLISMLDVNELLRSTKRLVRSRYIPLGLQLPFNM